LSHWLLIAFRGGGAAMRVLLQLCFAFVLTGTLAACGSLPTQNFDHSTRATVKRVEIIPIGTPEHAQARIMNPIGAGFGLVGNFVELRRKAGATQEMESALAAAHYDFRTSLTNAIAQAVSKVGFTINKLTSARPDKEQGKFLSRYPTPAKKVDAYLDVYATYVGFEAPQSSMPQPGSWPSNSCELVRPGRCATMGLVPMGLCTPWRHQKSRLLVAC
jgi:hypothetical protein